MGMSVALGKNRVGIINRLSNTHDKVRMVGDMQNENIIRSVEDSGLRRNCVKLNSSVTRLMRVVSGLDIDNMSKGESIVLERELDLAMGYLEELKSHINN